MWFSRLTIKNVGPFTDFDIKLKRGLIGIVGPNGSGKSTLLDLMYATLTNDWSRFDGVKLDCINNRSEKGDPSYVRAVVEHNDRKLVIVRGLRKMTTSFSVDGGEEITNANKIQEEIEKILQTDKDKLNLFVFKQQDKIYDFLTVTDAVRKKTFQSLCHTEICEELWDMLGDILNKDTELNEVLVDNSDELNQASEECRTSLEELYKKRDEQSALLLNPASYATANRLLERNNAKVSAEKALADRKDFLKELRESLAEDEATLQKEQATFDKLTKAYEPLKLKVLSARLALGQIETYEKNKKRQKRLRAEYEELRAENDAHSKPKGEVQEDKLNELKDERTTLKNSVAAATVIVETFDAKGIVACPTCNTPVSSLKAYLAAQRKIIADAPERLAEIKRQIGKINDLIEAHSDYRDWQVGFSARAQANEDALADLVDLKEPEGSKEDLEKVVEDHDQVESDLTAASEELATAQTEVAKMKSRISDTKALIKQHRTQIEENTVDDAKLAKAKQRLSEHGVATVAIAKLEGQIEGLEQKLAGHQSDLDKLRARMKRGKKLRRVARVTNRVRDVLHRDNLPLRVSQANLLRMESDINDNLGLFASPYWVEPKEDLSFIVHKPGEPPQNAGRLSTGQRVVLAISFWFAVAALWKSEIGMQALDEPTANLDEENRAFLASALQLMNGKIRDSRQVIMVTHADNMKSSFDQLIDLFPK